MGSLKSERIDSTDTTISLSHTVTSFRSKHVLFFLTDLQFLPVGCFLLQIPYLIFRILAQEL